MELRDLYVTLVPRVILMSWGHSGVGSESFGSEVEEGKELDRS